MTVVEVAVMLFMLICYVFALFVFDASLIAREPTGA